MAIKSENDIFSHFGLGPDGRPAPAQGNGPTQAELAARLAALEAENNSLKQSQQTLLHQKPTPAQQWQPVALPEFSMDGLPDQFSDPEGYNKAFAARLSDHQRKTLEIDRANARAEQEQRAAQSGKVDQLWQGFERSHPDLAKQRDLVEFAAGKVAAEAAAKGIDVERYLFATPDAFYNDVAGYVTKLNPSLGKAADPEPEEDQGIFSGGPGIPEGRTGGIAGGEEGNFKPSSGGGDAPGDMIEDLKKLQRASGFF
jgi:hypothetical protein